MTAKERTTIYVPVELMEQARALNINISQAATAGLMRAVKKAVLMAEAEKKIEQELNMMEA